MTCAPFVSNFMGGVHDIYFPCSCVVLSFAMHIPKSHETLHSRLKFR